MNELIINQAVYADANDGEGYKIVAETSNDFSKLKSILQICHGYTEPESLNESAPPEIGEIIFIIPLTLHQNKYLNVSRTSKTDFSDTGRASIIAHHIYMEMKPNIAPCEIISFIFGVCKNNNPNIPFLKRWDSTNGKSILTSQKYNIPELPKTHLLFDKIPDITDLDKKLLCKHIAYLGVECLLNIKGGKIIVECPERFLKWNPTILTITLSLLPDLVQQKIGAIYPIWNELPDTSNLGDPLKTILIFTPTNSPFYKEKTQSNNNLKIISFPKDCLQEDNDKIVNNFIETLTTPSPPFTLRTEFNKYPNLMIDKYKILELIKYKEAKSNFINLPNISTYKIFQKTRESFFQPLIQVSKEKQLTSFKKASRLLFSKKNFDDLISITSDYYEAEGDISFLEHLLNDKDVKTTNLCESLFNYFINDMDNIDFFIKTMESKICKLSLFHNLLGSENYKQFFETMIKKALNPHKKRIILDLEEEFIASIWKEIKKVLAQKYFIPIDYVINEWKKYRKNKN